MAYLAKTARASAKVVGSATVGPEPMTEGSSPGTSEMTKVTTRAGRGGGGEPAALDGREMLAHAIHLRDRRAAFEQRPVDLLLVGEGQAGGGERQQRRGAARDQAEHEIIGREPAHRRQDARRRRRTRRVGHGMGGLDHLDMLGRRRHGRSG